MHQLNDHHAGEHTRKLLQYITSLPERSDQRVLSGQFVRWNHDASLDEIAGIHEKTGAWPAMVSGDYYTNDQKQAHPIDCSLTNRVLGEYAARGGIVSLSVHANNPATGGPAWDSACDLRQVVEEGSDAWQNWHAQLAQIGDGLTELADRGVSVLFRPFHEMNGGWFWWGNGEPDAYRQLWRRTCIYLTQERGLDNLLWVYSPSSQSDQLRYYPGDDVVDIVGFDAYTGDLPKEAAEQYRQLLSTGKPFGITEYGPCGPEPLPEPFDYGRLIEWIRHDFPQTAFFIAWRDHWGMNQNRGAKELLTDPWVVNRDGVVVGSVAG